LHDHSIFYLVPSFYSGCVTLKISVLLKKITIIIIFDIAFYCPKAIFPFFSWLPRFFGGAFFSLAQDFNLRVEGLRS